MSEAYLLDKREKLDTKIFILLYLQEIYLRRLFKLKSFNDVICGSLKARMLRFFFFWNFIILCICILLRFSYSNMTDSTEVSTMSSREQVQPMPLITHLNKSAADILIQEANSIYVSNTSFDDLVNDNDTHQLFLRYRERKRQVRLKTIQHEILLKLGLEQEPNVTRMTEQQRINLVSSFDRLQEMREMNNTDMDT